jgi:hypothetical protein
MFYSLAIEYDFYEFIFKLKVDGLLAYLWGIETLIQCSLHTLLSVLLAYL